ncbi:response regulator [Roseococcus sp. YIM B11640]|uniref:response regulator n=1 Tax=Roseococcus sp. YIM B11640 TaxID=3133973 RepID=UPI003C7972B6
MSWGQEPPTPLVGRKVLVVEDQYLLADDICSVVKRLGGEILGPVSRVEDAMAALRTQPLDFALLDVNLEGEMVYPVAAALQDIGVPFVFTSGYDAAVIDPRFETVPHLAKPVGQGQLTEAIRRILDQPAR